MIHRFGEGYFVRALRESDLNGPFPAWFEDQEICRFSMHRKFPKTPEYFRDSIKNSNVEDRVVWAICHEADGHIGNVCLQGISFINRHAELGIVLGDKRHWRKGVGRQACEKILEHGFLELGLERIYCSAAAPNVAMTKLAERLGMLLEATRKEHVFIEGRGVDVVEYAILRSEFRRPGV